MMRKLIRYALYLCGSLLLAVLLYGAAAVLLGNWRIQAQKGAEKADITVYLISNGAHTDIAMPLHHPAFSWTRYASPQDTAGGSPNARYIAVGWGDRKFYLETPTWGDLTAATALRAIGGLNQTALHVSFLDDVPENERTAAITVSERQYRQLAHNIAADFQQENGRSRPIRGAHYVDNDAFYEANGRYHLFNTCNTWSNRHLKQIGAGGVAWTPFAHDVMNAFPSTQRKDER